MEQVIYVDILVFFNTLITFILLLTSAQITDIMPRAARLVTASFVGGMYSLMILAPPMNAFAIFIARTAMAVTLILITFSPNGFRKFIRSFAVFLLSSFLYFGIIYSVYYFTTPSFLRINNGCAYFDISAGSVILISALIYAVLVILKKFVLKKANKDDLYQVSIRFDDKIVSGTALLDTGNALRDIFTDRPVAVVNTEFAFALTGEIIRTDHIMPENSLKIRLLPVKTVAGEKLLPAFSADKLTVFSDGKEKTTEHISIAVTDDKLGGEKYSLLIGNEFI